MWFSKVERWQQWIFVALAMAPGFLVILKLISPVQAGTLVLLAYIFSRRHANALQIEFEKKLAEEEARKKAEEERILALPSKKRKNVLKGVAKLQDSMSKEGASLEKDED